jgi:hypothetical protein
MKLLSLMDGLWDIPTPKTRLPPGQAICAPPRLPPLQIFNHCGSVFRIAQIAGGGSVEVGIEKFRIGNHFVSVAVYYETRLLLL